MEFEMLLRRISDLFYPDPFSGLWPESVQHSEPDQKSQLQWAVQIKWKTETKNDNHLFIFILQNIWRCRSVWYLMNCTDFLLVLKDYIVYHNSDTQYNPMMGYWCIYKENWWELGNFMSCQWPLCCRLLLLIWSFAQHCWHLHVFLESRYVQHEVCCSSCCCAAGSFLAVVCCRFRGKNRSDRCCRLMLFFLSLFLSLIGMTQAAAVISTVIVGRHQRAWITPARPWQSQQVGALPASLALTWLWKPSDIQKGTDLHWMHHWINTADYQLTYTVLCRQRRNRERGGKKHMPV